MRRITISAREIEPVTGEKDIVIRGHFCVPRVGLHALVEGAGEINVKKLTSRTGHSFVSK